MVRIPSFSRDAATATRDENGDGRIDERNERLSAGSRPASVRDRADDSTTYRGAPYPTNGAATTGTDRKPDLEPGPEVVTPVGPRPRASLLATLGLIFGVAAVLFVLSGALAGYGIGLGVLALLLSAGGLSATGRRHVAGKSDALIGLLLGLGAVVVGALALAGQLAWPTTDADTVGRFAEWLDTQFVNRF